MPLATAASDARARRRVTAAVLTAALQAIFYWLILREAVEPTALPRSTPFEVTILQTARRFKPVMLRRKRVRPLRRTGQGREVAPRTEVTEAIPSPQPPQPASHAPIDWRRAIRGEVRAEESESRAGKLPFGFPQRPASAPPPSEFGWDYAHTHRLEPLPQGGILVNLNDRCALVIYGFLILPGCRIGRIPANGHLFDHMRNSRNSDFGGLP